MIDEKLNTIILRYGIYDSIGGTRKTILKRQSVRHGLLAIGVLRLAYILNRFLWKTADDKIVLCSDSEKWIRLMWHLLLPSNQRKINYIILTTMRKGVLFHGRSTIEFHEIGEYDIHTAILISMDSGLYAKLLNWNFDGEIIDTYSLIVANHWEKFFQNAIREDIYADISIARFFVEQSNRASEKQKWRKRLIAHFLRARDFVNAELEIRDYVTAGYEDSKKYLAFLRETENLLSEIKQKMQDRVQRDIFLHWLDAMEKEDFFEMAWLGRKENGRWFHRAYTTMDYTKSVMRSIFSGENVKAGNLMTKSAQYDEENTVFAKALKEYRLLLFSRNAMSVFKKFMIHPIIDNSVSSGPISRNLWYALDTVLSSSDPCICLIHAMEAHPPYNSGGNGPGKYYGVGNSFLPANTVVDFSAIVEKSRAYIDKQLEWYYGFFPPTAISVYFSDHGHEANLTERNINMPFKIMGSGIESGDEYRLFSFKDMHKLIDCLVHSGKDMAACFSEYAVVDIIDPYDMAYMKNICEVIWHGFCYERRVIGKEELKKYIQTTKVVTAQGEYYTVNILGEETYCRDVNCKINLVDNPLYVNRLAELRKIAGKFHNPWKENRNIAIDFYTRIGIVEEDIRTQCY